MEQQKQASVTGAILAALIICGIILALIILSSAII